MRACPYAEGGMAAATGGFDLGSLVPKLPGAGLIDQLTNPWNWMNLANQAASLVNLFLYYRLHRRERRHQRRRQGTECPCHRRASLSSRRDDDQQRLAA